MDDGGYDDSDDGNDDQMCFPREIIIRFVYIAVLLNFIMWKVFYTRWLEDGIGPIAVWDLMEKKYYYKGYVTKKTEASY